MTSSCKQLEQLLSIQKSHPIIHEFKDQILEITLVLRNLDPLKSAAATVINSEKSELPSFVHAIQPMLVFEALLHPTSDLNALSLHLHSVSQILGNVTFSELVYEIMRSLLLTISQKEGLEPLKVDAFVLVRLPVLLEKLFKLSRNENSVTILKTPTDLYKAFDKLLSNDALLDSTDLR